MNILRFSIVWLVCTGCVYVIRAAMEVTDLPERYPTFSVAIRPDYVSVTMAVFSGCIATPIILKLIRGSRLVGTRAAPSPTPKSPIQNPK